jgi:Na+/H+ antiporter NhaD/arsenite permease-like protein
MQLTAGQMHAVLAIFVLTYAGLAIGRIPGLRLDRTGMAIMGAILMMIITGDSTGQVAAAVNWPTIFMLFGFFVMSAQLRLSGFYDYIAVGISERVSAPASFLVFLIAVTAALSAFLNNDIVCYVLTPVVGAALVRRQINPVPFLIALAAASNIGAAATLIGNGQNMMIGAVAHLGFLAYILWAFVPVLVGLVAVYAVTRIGKIDGPPVLQASDIEPVDAPVAFNKYHSAKGLVILAGVIVFFFTPVPREITVLVAASIHFLSSKFQTRQLLNLVDWPVLLIFMALFVVSGTFQETGYAARLVGWMEGIGFDPTKAHNETLLTAGLSVLINNAPAVMVLIKIIPLTHASVAYILALANSFAGSAFMTSSIANLIVVQQARRQGIEISFGAFARHGIPIAVLSLGGLMAWSELMGP